MIIKMINVILKGNQSGELEPVGNRWFTGLWKHYCICESIFCVKRGSRKKSDKLLQVVSLESVSIGSEDYKFENEKKNLGVRRGESEVSLLDLCRSSSQVEASGSRLH